MIEKEVCDYAAYLKLDLSGDFQRVQNVIDNMITRLEELASVVQMIKLKNNDCRAVVSEDLYKYRNEIAILSKKVATLINVILKLEKNIGTLEKQVEKAEFDFGLSNDSKLTSFLKPFFRKNKDTPTSPNILPATYEKFVFSSVLDNFDNNES